MDHIHRGNAKENNQVTEATNDSLNTSVNQSLHDYIMRTKASNADKTLTENAFKELIRQNILINKKTTQYLDSFKILKNVD